MLEHMEEIFDETDLSKHPTNTILNAQNCRGSQARLKAQASGACRAGVRGFESHPLHHGQTLCNSKVFPSLMANEAQWLLRRHDRNRKEKTQKPLFVKVASH